MRREHQDAGARHEGVETLLCLFEKGGVADADALVEQEDFRINAGRDREGEARCMPAE